MIVFELICPEYHRFEGWFSSSDDFDGQKNRGLLSCPSCGRTDIEKLPTAKIRSAVPDVLPAVRQEKGSDATVQQSPVSLHELIDYVLMNTDNVGKEFAAEARRIHRHEVPFRGIRGTASRQETEELLDEGVPVMALPIPSQNDWH